MRVPPRLAVLLAALLVIAAPALAEVIIHLKDGKAIYLPIDQADIARIDYGAGQEAPAPETDRPAAAPTTLPPPSAFREPEVRRDAAKPEIVRVGPKERFKRPSEAVDFVKSGDTVEIAAGVYENDFVEWEQNNLTLRGVGGRAHLKATDYVANDKGIWITSGDNIVVENIEFSGAQVDDENGAGIRHQGKRLTVRNSYFHHNQMGILTHNESGGVEVTVENSEFGHNLEADPASHALYIGMIDKFRLTGSYVHHTQLGHHVKSRARENFIAYNRLTDEQGGTASYAIDIPNCGRAIVLGNLIHKSGQADNNTAISFGSSECPADRPQELYIVNNTFVNDELFATFFTNHRQTPAILRNNLIVGVARLADGPAVDDHNVIVLRGQIRDRAKYDFHLAAGSAAIDAGVAPGATKGGVSLAPVYQYRYPRGVEPRPAGGKIDAGAYEFVAPARKG